MKRRKTRKKLTHVRSRRGEHFFLTEGDVSKLRRVAKKRFKRWADQPGARGFKIVKS